jgi:hypothetical protein
LKWEDLSAEDILENTPEGILYDGYDEDSRRPIEDLSELLIMNGSEEIPIYNEDGFRISRRTATTEDDAENGDASMAILMNLREIRTLFETDNEGIIEEDPVKLDVYPQAYLHSVGHFQANRLITGFEKTIRSINQKIGARRGAALRDELFGDIIDNEDANEQDEADPGADLGRMHAVKGIACQGYNEVMHRLRGQGGDEHDAQLGMITGALSGTYATTKATRTKHEKLMKRCEDELPHERAAQKLRKLDDHPTDPNLDVDFRLENVYCVDIRRLRPASQNGA